MFEVHFFGLVALTKEFIATARAHQGRIINISSITGLFSVGAMSSDASKYAVEGFSDSLRRELYPFGSAVVLICPGYIDGTKASKLMIDYIEQQGEFADKWKEIYGPYLNGTVNRLKSHFGKGDNAEIATNDIIHGALSSRPHARYFPGAANDLPAWLAVLLSRVIPTNLFDIMANQLDD